MKLKDTTQQSQAENALQILISFYYEQWPCDDLIIMYQLESLKTDLKNEAIFQQVLTKFNAFIDSFAGRHPFRYTSKTWLWGGVRWVYKSEEFKKLKEILQNFKMHEQKSWLETLKSAPTIIKDGCSNVIETLLHNPSQAIVMGLTLQVLLQPTLVRAKSIEHNDWDGDLLNTCPQNSYKNSQLIRDLHSCQAPLINFNPFLANHALDEKRPTVLLFGEHHHRTDIARLMNHFFPTLLGKEYVNYVDEHTEDYTVDKLIETNAPSIIRNLFYFPPTQDWFAFYTKIKQHSFNYFPVDDGYQIKLIFEKFTLADQYRCLFNFYLANWFNCETEQMIAETLDTRDQFMANKILKVLKDTEKNVFGRFGRLHSGIAKHLLDAGYSVTFIACPEVQHSLASKVDAQRKEMERHYPHFRYFVLPEELEEPYLENLKKIIFEAPKKDEGTLSFFIEPPSKELQESGSRQQKNDILLERKKTLEDAKDYRAFYFFKNHSQATLETEPRSSNDENLVKNTI